MRAARIRESAGYVLAYAGALGLGVALIVPGQGLSMFAPAAGVGALWMLRGTTARQVVSDAALLVAINIVLIPVGSDFRGWGLLFFALANLVQAFGVRVVRAVVVGEPVAGAPSIETRSPGELLRLISAAFVAALVSAPLIVLALRLGDLGWRLEVAPAWIVRNTSGAIVVIAVVLALRGARRERLEMGWSVREALAGVDRPRILTELLLAFAMTLATALVVFATDGGLPLGFLIIATSAWIGFRFTPVVAGVHIAVFGSLALRSAVTGTGPFGSIDDLLVRGIVVQLFVATTALITLLLSLGVAERARLADRLRASEAEAASRARLLDAVSDSLRDGVAVVDAQGAVVMSNRAADAMGTPVQDLARPAALSGESVAATDVVRVDPVTGAQSILSMSATPFEGADGERLALVHLRDATAERAETRELRAFAGIVAHDLGNPLYALMSWAEVLDDQLDDLEVDASAARASVLAIYRSGEQMRQLIADLLLLTRTRSSDLEVLSVSLDQVVDAVAAEIAARSWALPPRVEHDTLGRVLVDPTLVRQVVANLLGNAVKYVAPGVPPLVRVTSRVVGDQLEVQVADNGVGIPATDRGKIFDSWFRSESTSDSYPGTGLGLSIAATAVERHGGTISARAGDDGTGTTFTFTLPHDPEDGTARPGQREGRTTSADPPPRRTGSDAAVS